MAVVGFLMVAVSVFYLLEYARSGSDAEDFNIQAAAPEEYLEFLGRGIPNPGIRPDPVTELSPDLKSSPAESEQSAKTMPGARVSLRSDPQIDHIETVSIASVLPGLSLVSEPEPSDSVVNGSFAEVESISGEYGSKSRVASGNLTDEPRSGRQSAPAAPSSSLLLETFASIYPGGNMNPRYWSDPHWAGNMPFGGPTIPEGFLPVDASAMKYELEGEGQGLRMRIPAIDLDAIVSELELRDLGDARQWSTPDKVVGHIPTTADPGESAHGWYFGHLSNFISNEGDIFRRLPEIAGMIKNDPVDIFVTTADTEYMYRVTESRQLHRNDLHLTETNSAQITLVTCWPFRVYDHRILVSAVLIAVKPLHEA